MPRVRRFDLYEGLGSDVTSSTFFVGDATEITLQVLIGSTSTVTVQTSNATGFREAFTEDDWSNVTTWNIAADEMINIEPGFRWLRLQRNGSSASQANLGVYGPY